MDEVLKLALAGPLPEIKEDTPEVLPAVAPANQERRAHQ
jgi:ATP-dependent Lon protease